MATLIIAALTLAAAIPAGWYAWRTAVRDTRRADVSWHVVRFERDGIRVVNRGRDDAHEVGISLVVDDAEHLQREEAVTAPGTPVDFRSERLASAAERVASAAEKEDRLRRADERKQRQSESGVRNPFQIAMPHIPRIPQFVLPEKVPVQGQITWRSKGRRWDRQIVDEVFVIGPP